jgi:ferric-dicitrate binding protein FerR (iron transport regulator)
MKPSQLEKWVLLEQSGELAPRDQLRLKRALDGSAAARHLRDDLRQIEAAVMDPASEPSPWTAVRIDARLRAENPAGVPLRRWKPALSLAAGALLMAGLFTFHGQQNSSSFVPALAAAEVDAWSDPFEEDLVRLENLIAAASGDTLDLMEM